MSIPGIHLIAPAGSCKPFLGAIEVPSADALIALVQEAVGPNYRVTGNQALIEADEDQYHGGRTDDQARVEDIGQALADDTVVAMILLRGGAWFTRLLPLLDFSVLDRRTERIAAFGFSELTTLVNIVGAFNKGIGVYDMGPAFLTYGLKRHDRMRDDAGPRIVASPLVGDEPLPLVGDGATDGMPSPGEGMPSVRSGEWMLARLRREFVAFFRDVVAIIEGRGTDRAVTARLVRGDMPDSQRATFVGGNLTVLSTMVGSPYEAFVKPDSRWLLLEDFNDKLERIDRFLSHLTLARYWDACEGVLLGDFHKGYEDLTPGVLELLRYHIPRTRPIPVLVTKDVGHVWPMAPLPLHAELTIERTNDDRYAIHWPSSLLRIV